MADKKMFPTVAMKQTAKDIRTILDAQWQKHLDQFQNHPDSVKNLTSSLINNIVPHEQSQSLDSALDNWQGQLHKCYQALYAIADALEQGSTAALEADDQLQKTFNGFDNGS